MSAAQIEGGAELRVVRCPGFDDVQQRAESVVIFPSDDATIKLLWLAIYNIEDKRARDRAKEHGRGRDGPRKAEPRLVEGQITTNWKQALAQLQLAYPDRIDPYL